MKNLLLTALGKQFVAKHKSTDYRQHILFRHVTSDIIDGVI